jgi:ribosomal protein S17E
MSPIRLIRIAFIAALFACKRPYQKLIKRYEHKPTPSHPKNNWKKLSAVTKINIKNVNNDK